MHSEQGILQLLANLNYGSAPRDLGQPAIKGAVPVSFSPEHFRSVEPRAERLCFVDGGNNTIYLAPGHSIQIVRLYYSLFNGDERERAEQYTFVLDAYYYPERERYTVTIHDVERSGLLPGEMDIAAEYLSREKINGVGAYVRRIGEWLLMNRISSYCPYIVRDGSLQTGEPGESEYQEQVFEKVKGIVGLSKTSTLLTTRGVSVVAAVHYLAKKHRVSAPWYYHPVAKNIPGIKGDMFVVKLHEFSEYAFRTEIYPAELADTLIGALVPQSNDARFPGYPYGLIDADVNARIPEDETKLYRNMVGEYLDEFLTMEMRALDAHDRISEVK